MQLKTPEQADEVLNPRVRGTQVLGQVLQTAPTPSPSSNSMERERKDSPSILLEEGLGVGAGKNTNTPLDFIALFGSTVAQTGGLGQVDECAANAFLDAYAHAHDSLPLGSASGIVSIDWSGWYWDHHLEELAAGMPQMLEQVTQLRELFGIKAEEAGQAFERILASGEPQIIVSTEDLAGLIDQQNVLTATNFILSQHRLVQETVVIVRKDQADDQRLVAYVVLSPADAWRSGQKRDSLILELRSHLKQKLPNYMIPGFFVVLDQLPLTPNGKIDRRRLPAPESSGSLEESYVPPNGPTEEKLAAIWSEVLGLERVGRHNDFFELGGHSLLATQIMLHVTEAFEIEQPLRELLQYSTVAELAEQIDSSRQTLATLQDMTSISDDDREEFVL